MTKNDVRGDGWQNFWRQSTVATLIKEHPIPKGCERILVILDDVDEEELREEHPELNHIVCKIYSNISSTKF